MKPIVTLVKISLFATIAAAVAACSALPKHQLSEAEIRTFSLQAVKVNMDDTTRIQWARFNKEQKLIKEGKSFQRTAPGEVDNKYLLVASSDAIKEVLNDNGETVTKVTYASEASDRHRDKMLKEPLELSLEESLSKIMSGDRPVRAEVTVHMISVPSTAQKILIGGTNGMIVDFRLVDIGTNSTLALYPKKFILGSTANGLEGVIIEAAVNGIRKKNKYEVMTHGMGRFFSNWLVPAKDEDDGDDATI